MLLLYRNIGSNEKDAVSFSVQTNAKNVCCKKADRRRVALNQNALHKKMPGAFILILKDKQLQLLCRKTTAESFVSYNYIVQIYVIARLVSDSRSMDMLLVRSQQKFQGLSSDLVMGGRLPSFCPPQQHIMDLVEMYSTTSICSLSTTVHLIYPFPSLTV